MKTPIGLRAMALGLGLLGCQRRAPAPPAAVTALQAVAPDAGSVVTETPVPVAPRGFVLPANLPAPRGLLLAARPGARVRFVADAAPDASVELAEGTEVTYVDDDAAVGVDAPTAAVVYQGARGRVPNAAVVTEARLTRNPAGTWAVFSAIATCGDFCHSDAVLFGPDGLRRALCAEGACGGPAVRVSWHPTEPAMAVDLGGVSVYALGASEAPAVEASVTAPSYAPDGALFARAVDASQRVMVRRPGAAWAPFLALSRSPRGEPPEEFSPVVFEGDVVCAAFHRAAETQYRRALRGTGRPAPGAGPCTPR